MALALGGGRALVYYCTRAGYRARRAGVPIAKEGKACQLSCVRITGLVVQNSVWRVSQLVVVQNAIQGFQGSGWRAELQRLAVPQL
jgi:hypothetical protein